MCSSAPTSSSRRARVARRVAAALPVVALEPDELVEQLVAARDEALALGGQRRRRPRGRVAATTPIATMTASASVSAVQRGAVLWCGIPLSASAIGWPGGNARPLRGDVGLAVGRHVLLRGQLRRRERRAADLLDDDGELLELRREASA